MISYASNANITRWEVNRLGLFDFKIGDIIETEYDYLSRSFKIIVPNAGIGSLAGSILQKYAEILFY